MKTTVMCEVFVDLVLEDVLNDGRLFEGNPYHDAAGKFTSKDAATAYASGAMAKGRAAGMKAKTQGLGHEAIRAAIKDAMAKHLADKGTRAMGQGRLDLIRGKIEKGTLPGQKQLPGSTAHPATKARIAREAAAPAKPTYGELNKVAPKLGVADQAYIHGLLQPETDSWKRQATAGNIDRQLELHTAGKLDLPKATVDALKKAKEELTKPEATPAGAEKPKVAAEPEIDRMVRGMPAEKLTASHVRDFLAGHVDKVSGSGKAGFTARHGYFYTMGRTPEKMAAAIKKEFEKVGKQVEVESTRDKWAPWPKDSYHEVKFKVKEAASAGKADPAKAAADAVRQAAKDGGVEAGQREFIRQAMGLLGAVPRRR